METMTLKKLHDSIEKIAHYLATEVPRQGEVATKEDLNKKSDKSDIEKLLNGQDKIVHELEII